ncbi:MAG TPA: circularly permuted type 2 ATP-grasp protein [Acidimicrobiales bacterium]|nr:circularly permuted type 2 ATP-grasp protein [Acidimicrobiales bacterium]
MGDLLDEYAFAAGWDEMFDPTGAPRPSYRALHQALQVLSAEEFANRCAARDRAFLDQGITFSHSGEERLFPLDLFPRVLSAGEWSHIEKGVTQRVLALERFLDDVYGEGQILRDGIVPRRCVTTATHFHRPAFGVQPVNGARVQVAGIDLVRGDEQFHVLEDNVRTPSGISYVIENRRAMARVFPELFASHRVRPVDAYPARLLEALRAAAPAGAGEPTVVLLTPGVYNSAYFEHAFLARQMGVELVEGRDLVCRENLVYMRSTEGEQRVDVVYRRVDDDFLDPLHFRSDSVVGCPGILNAARAGNVTIANAVGNGVADDKLVYTYVPAMIEYYLGEKTLLPNVTTYRLEDPDQLAHALPRLDQLVMKPVDGSGGYGLVIGPQAGDEELAGVRAAIQADPRAWIAQEVVRLSTSPTQVGDRLKPRHVDLRPFAVNDGERVWVVPGGLTRVALVEGSLVVNSSQGGGSKDTWVLATTDAGRNGRMGAGVPGQAAPATPVPGHDVTQLDPGPAVAQVAQQQQQPPATRPEAPAC